MLLQRKKVKDYDTICDVNNVTTIHTIRNVNNVTTEKESERL